MLIPTAFFAVENACGHERAVLGVGPWQSGRESESSEVVTVVITSYFYIHPQSGKRGNFEISAVVAEVASSAVGNTPFLVRPNDGKFGMLGMSPKRSVEVIR